MIATACRRCREPFEPDRAAILAGAWRVCPACRDPEADHPPGGCSGRRCRGRGPPPATDPTGPTRPTNRRIDEGDEAP